MAHVPQTLRPQRITPQEAAQAFEACAGLDPQGKATPESAAKAGECYALIGQGGRVVVSVAFAGGVAWVHGAAGGAQAMAGPALEAIERLALANDCMTAAFVTKRPGLKRVATRRGYAITQNIGEGWRLSKNL